MSNHAWTRPLGVWNPGVIRATELADLDAKTVKSPNFDGGGTYAPTAAIYVGGEGMQIKLVGTSTVDASAELEVSGSLTVPGYFEVSGSIANFYSEVFFGGFLGVNFATPNTHWISGTTATFDVGSTLKVEGTLEAAGLSVADIQVTNSLQVAADCPANLNGSLNVSQIATFHGDANLEGTTAVKGNLALTGAGTIIDRIAIGTNADSTYSVSTADLVYIGRPTFTASRTYYLDEVGAANGKKIRFHREDDVTANVLTLKRSVDGSTICTLGWRAADYIWTDVVRIAGVWRRVGGQFGES